MRTVKIIHVCKKQWLYLKIRNPDFNNNCRWTEWLISTTEADLFPVSGQIFLDIFSLPVDGVRLLYGKYNDRFIAIILYIYIYWSTALCETYATFI